jgi:hypothetical protein
MLNNKYFEERIALYKETKENIKNGVFHALRAYDQSQKYGLDEYTVEETPFAQDMGNFMEALDEAGITEFNLCEKSSGLMSILHCLLKSGWMVMEPFEKEVDRYTRFYGLRMKKKSIGNWHNCRIDFSPRVRYTVTIKSGKPRMNKGGKQND